MSAERIKSAISESLTELKMLLNTRKLERFIDGDGANHISFNGYSYLETFENEVDLTVDLLIGHIDQDYVYNLDKEKRLLLIEHIIDSIDVSEFSYYHSYNAHFSELDDKSREIVNAFERVQVSLKEHVVERLTKQFLSEIKVEKTKIARIQWLGEQKELAELFDQLKRKKWITISGSAASYYRAIDLLFDVSGTNDLQTNFKIYHSPGTSNPITTQGVFSALPPRPVK